MTKPLFLGIDLGTSSCRALLIDEQGVECGSGASEYAFDTPQPGRAEQDPEIWWTAAASAVRQSMEAAEADAGAVRAIGLSGQMHGTVLLDSAGRVIRPAILWADGRSADECAHIREAIGEDRHYALTGNPCAAGFQGPSLLWVRKHEPEPYNRTTRVLLPKDWLRFRMTGMAATEPTDACGTALFDIRESRWSEAILGALGLNNDLFPPVLKTLDVAGHLTSPAAESLGLRSGTPVIAGGGDQAMAALGMGLVDAGDAAIAISTGGQFLAVTDRLPRSPARGIHTICHAMDNRWMLMGAILSAGLSLRWLRDNVFHLPPQSDGQSTYAAMTAGAGKAPPGSDGLLFLPYLAGERTPHLDPHARGSFHGLTTSHTRAHLIRAVMEGVAFAFRDSLDLLHKSGIRPRSVIVSGGGSRSPVWRQILADVLRIKLRVIGREEHSAHGAALAAAIGVGALSDASTSKGLNEITDTTRPIRSNARLYAGLCKRYHETCSAVRGLHAGQ